MQASSANFSVEQVELIRRLRNSGITCEQLINAFQALERIDAILGNTFNAPVNSRLQQHIRNYDGGNHKENETSPAISTSATVLGEPSCSQPLLTLLTPPVSMKVPVRNPSSEQNTHEGLQGFSQTQTTSALNSPDESPPEHLLPEIELHTKGKAPVSSSNSPATKGHSLKNHMDRLSNLCRLCARRCLNRDQLRKCKKPRSIQDFQKEILTHLHINVSNDTSGFHSPSICSKCISTLINIRCFGYEIALEKLIKTERSARRIWEAYSDSLELDGCKMCNHYNSFTGGAIPLKKRKESHHSDDVSRQSPDHLPPAPPKFNVSCALENRENFNTTTLDDTPCSFKDNMGQSQETELRAPQQIFLQAEISGPSQSECGNATLNQRVASSDPTKLPSEELTQDHCLALLWRSGYDKVMNVVNKCLTTHEFQPLQQAKEIGVKGSSMQAFLRGDFFCIDQSTCYNLMGWLIKICHNAEWFKVEMEKLLDPQDNQEESDVQLVPRRERITYLECHLQVLETFWLNNQYPTPSEKELIAERCNHAMAVWAERPLEDKEKLSHLNVANWFKNKRKINRRNAKKGESRGEATKTFLDHPNVNSTANQAANSPLIGEHEQASSTQQNVSQTLRKRLHPSSFVRIPSDLGYNHSSSSVSDEHEQANSNQHVSQTLQERLHPESASSSIVRILSNFSNNYFDSNNSNTASTMLSSLSSQVAKDSWKVSSSSHLDPVAESHPVHLFQNSAFAHSAAVAGSSDVEGHTNPVTVDEIPGSPTNNPVPAVMAATSNSHESAVVFRESDDEVDTKPFALVSMSDSLPHNPVPALTAVTPDIHDSAVHRGSDDEVDTKPAIVDSMPGSPTHNPVPALTAATPDSHESADVKEEAIYPMPTIKV